MDEREYEKLAAVEDTMWWFRGLHAILAAFVEAYGGRDGRLLDAGCGTGGLLRALGARGAQARFGLDVFPAAVAKARDRSGAHVLVGSVNALPFPDGSFECIVSADVLCHSAVDVDRSMREIHRCLRPGGHLILQLPAYQWLSSYHDVHCRQVRRFTRRGLEALAVRHGFAPRFSSYWNAILFPLVVARRKLLPAPRDGSDVAGFSGPANRVLAAVVAFESRLLARGLAIPFGSSVVLVARKPLPAPV